MTDLAAAVLTLRPVESGIVPHWTGPYFRAWFLTQITHHDPALAEALQIGDNPRPYTVSSLLHTGRNDYLTPEQTYAVRITTLQTSLTRLLIDHLLREWTDQVISFNETLLRIESCTLNNGEHPWAGTTTDAALIQEHTLQPDALSRSVVLRFDSPTTFHSQHGLVMPFPLPALVFGSLIDRWNTFNEIRLHPDTRRFAEECIEVRQHRIRTERVALSFEEGEGRTAGFLGYCRYLIQPGDLYWRGVIHALSGYTFYAGVGAHTTMGLGRARLHRDQERK
jgi:CRISPR-associated endoribonuclease Cas6